MGMYDALEKAALEAAGSTVAAGDKKMADALEPLWTTAQRLRSVYLSAGAANSDEARMRGIMDVRMAAEEYVKAAKAAKDGFAAIHKSAASALDALEAEMVPFAAEQNITGSTHVAIYRDGSDRVLVKDYALARRSTPDRFWRTKEDDLDKRMAGEAMKGGEKLPGIEWDQGPPSLRIVKLDGVKDGNHE